jgi:maltose O-acetyltransferase
LDTSIDRERERAWAAAALAARPLPARPVQHREHLHLRARVAREVRRLVANVLGGSPLLPNALRPAVYRWCLLGVGHGVEVEAGAVFRDVNVVISDDVYIGDRCYFDCHDLIVIGPGAQVGAGSMLITGTHDLGPPHGRAGTWRSAPIVVAGGAWIGAAARVLPGVTIGEGCLIGAGAVVTRDCAPHGLYVGVPAKRVRDLPA